MCRLADTGAGVPIVVVLHGTSCFRCPILVGCPAEPCSWRLYLGILCITKNLSYMRALRSHIGDGLWYNSGVQSTRDGARSFHRDTDLRRLSSRHRHVAEAGAGRSCPFGEFILWSRNIPSSYIGSTHRYLYFSQTRSPSFVTTCPSTAIQAVRKHG
jgi:hypothetical protein